MRIKLLKALFLIITLSTIQAQVGVNTSAPQSMFHIDGGKDNPTTGVPSATQIYNDVFIKSDANLGIGTLPDTSTRVNVKTNTSTSTQFGTGFRLKDTTEGDGNLLSLVNSQGDVAWKKRIATVRGTFGPGFSGSVTSDMTFTTTTIVLPPGKWLIRSSIILRVQSTNGTFSDGLFAQLSWADKNPDGTYSLATDATSGNLFGGSYLGMYSLAFGQTIMDNTTSSPKTYYLVTRSPKTWGTSITTKTWQQLAGNVWGENAIIAFAAN